jgi:hypothetical protein
MGHYLYSDLLIVGHLEGTRQTGMAHKGQTLLRLPVDRRRPENFLSKSTLLDFHWQVRCKTKHAFKWQRNLWIKFVGLSLP